MNNKISENIDESELNTLKQLARSAYIKKELLKLNETKEELMARSEIEEKDYSDEINKCETKKIILEKELQNYNDVKHKIELSLHEFIKAKGLLSKLEQKKETLSNNIFDKLKREYLENQKIAKNDYLSEYARLKLLKTNAEKKIASFDELKEEMVARIELGDISPEEGKKKISSLENDNEKNNTIVTAINNLQTNFTINAVD